MLDAAHRLFDIFALARVAEAEIALSARTERSAGSDADIRLIDKSERCPAHILNA